ncbi:MAG: ABC-2 family transporter protein [Polyangiaceae bacterium]
MSRYASLLWLQLRMSLVLGAQYRLNFLVDGAVALAWTAAGLVPLSVAFAGRQSIAGWSFEEMLVVMGWFTLLRGVLDGGVHPSLTAVVEQIRLGTLDFVLLKPADAQFLVSTAKFEPWKVADVVAGMAIFAWAFARMGRAPAPLHVLGALLLLVCAVVVLYSLWILVIAAAFYVVRLDNLSYLFDSLFDFARWPVNVYRGVLRVVFTVVVPLAVMTTYPAQALLGTLRLQTAALVVAGSLAFALAARLMWSRAIARYTSASS